MAQDEEDLPTAISMFEKTIETGRRLFPRRIKRADFWSDHDTRPFMRGLMNAASACNQAGRFDDAEKHSDRLHDGCGYLIMARSLRAAIALNRQDYKPALHNALLGLDADVSRAFIAGFAAFELASRARAASSFLHGVLNLPRTARMLVGVSSPPPKERHEGEDHNGGVALKRELRWFLQRQRPSARKYFHSLVTAKGTALLITEMEAVRKLAFETNADKDEKHDAWTKYNEMKTLGFAEEQAPIALGHLLPAPELIM